MVDREASATDGPWGCARHATLGRTCCQTAEVLVTAGDRERIAVATGGDDFWEFRAPADPAYLEQDDDPNWIRWAFRSDGARPVLRRRPEGDCTFLGLAGCTLGVELRPLVCRLFPYGYTEAGLGEAEDACPAEVVPPGMTILEMLEMTRVDAERWHRQLYAELRGGVPKCTSV